jgi:hypothetical protein
VFHCSVVSSSWSLTQVKLEKEEETEVDATHYPSENDAAHIE